MPVSSNVRFSAHTSVLLQSLHRSTWKSQWLIVELTARLFPPVGPRWSLWSSWLPWLSWCKGKMAGATVSSFPSPLLCLRVLERVSPCPSLSFCEKSSRNKWTYGLTDFSPFKSKLCVYQVQKVRFCDYFVVRIRLISENGGTQLREDLWAQFEML